MVEVTRDEMIRTLMEKARELVKNYTWDASCELWSMCSDWNTDHEECDEIFMSDTSDDDNVVNGFMIEDYVFIYED